MIRPIVEDVDMFRGFGNFCSGETDLIFTSRKIRESEVVNCLRKGVDDIVFFPIGYQSLVVTRSVDSPVFDLDREKLFLALSAKVQKGRSVVDNHYKKWMQIDENFPDDPIEVYGPPDDSGFYETLVDTVFIPHCINQRGFHVAYSGSVAKIHNVCRRVRKDGLYVDFSLENQDIIISKLSSSKNAIAIMNLVSFSQNEKLLHSLSIDGVEPTYENIIKGYYPLSQKVFLYAKKSSLKNKHMSRFLKYMFLDLLEKTGGHVGHIGITPLVDKELTLAMNNVRELTKVDRVCRVHPCYHGVICDLWPTYENIIKEYYPL